MNQQNEVAHKGEETKQESAIDYDNSDDNQIVSLECPRCLNGYPCQKDSYKTKQALNCASSIRVQAKYDMVYYLDLDGPPTPDLIPVGMPYLQGFYPSDKDGHYYSFTGLSQGLTLEKLQDMFPWVSRHACICDKCIDELVSEGLLRCVAIYE